MTEKIYSESSKVGVVSGCSSPAAKRARAREAASTSPSQQPLSTKHALSSNHKPPWHKLICLKPSILSPIWAWLNEMVMNRLLPQPQILSKAGQSCEQPQKWNATSATSSKGNGRSIVGPIARNTVDRAREASLSQTLLGRRSWTHPSRVMVAISS